MRAIGRQTKTYGRRDSEDRKVLFEGGTRNSGNGTEEEIAREAMASEEENEKDYSCTYAPGQTGSTSRTESTRIGAMCIRRF